jgi:flagellar hook-basal body complex protein FliE
MSSVSTLTVTPSGVSSRDAVAAYGLTDSADAGATGGTDATGFGAALQRAVQGAVSTGEAADSQAMQAIAGTGNITDVVTAVSRAQLALQSTVAIRDRVVSAYQDIMHMSI